MIEWLQGKRIRPPEHKCKAYCKDYPCNRTQCSRKQGFNANGIMCMLDSKTALELDLRIKYSIWRSDRETYENGMYGKARTLI